MALINCEECGKEISDKAVNCIGCGAPIDLERDAIKDPVVPHKDDAIDVIAWHTKNIIYKALIAIFMLIVVIWGWFLVTDTIRALSDSDADWAFLIGRWATFGGFCIIFTSIPKISRRNEGLPNKIFSFAFVVFNVFMPLAIWAIIATDGDMSVISFLVYLAIWLSGDAILFMLTYLTKRKSVS